MRMAELEQLMAEWNLTPMQKRIATCLIDGYPPKQIAAMMELDHIAMRRMCCQIYKATGTRNRLGLFLAAHKRNVSHENKRQRLRRNMGLL